MATNQVKRTKTQTARAKKNRIIKAKRDKYRKMR